MLERLGIFMNMIKSLIHKFKNLDKKTRKIMNIGFIFSFVLCIISILSLFTYEFFYSIPSLFYTGISLFRSSLMFACTFIICAIGFDTITKQIG